MPIDLTGATLIFVGAAAGEGGVGDYAEDFLRAVRGEFGEVVEIRTDRPGAARVSDVRSLRNRLRSALQLADSPVIVHFELSAAAVSPFWLLQSAPSTAERVTATVHDPPHAVWWPFRFRFLAAHRVLNHGIHYPLQYMSRRLEHRRLRNVQLFALSDIGAASMETSLTQASVIRARHYIPYRQPILEPIGRPLAFGLYGYAYRGKGFENLLALRASIPPDIDIIVAGRGTERLPRVPGIELLGELDEQQEAEFFARIRCIVLPYENQSRYGEILSVSGVAARAFAYSTPVVARATGTLPELALEGGMLASARSIEEVARQAEWVCRDRDLLRTLTVQADTLRIARRAEAAVRPFLNYWRFGS